MSDVRSSCVQLAIEIAADFNKRIVSQKSRLPLSIIWLVRKTAAFCCPRRKQVANELLSLLEDDSNDIKRTTEWKEA